jgi:tetratricopeptide (TPR) repeat protein
VETFVDGQKVAAIRANGAGGAGLALDVPVGRGAEGLEVVAQDGLRRGVFVLGLTEPMDCPEIERISSLRLEGRLETALEAAVLAATLGFPACRTRALGLSARLLLDLDRPGEAIPVFRKAMELGRGGDAISGWTDDALALAYTLITRQRDFEAARELLAEVEQEAAGFPEARGFLPYYRSLLALEVGDLRVAMAELERAFETASRLGMTRLRLGVAQARAELLALLGREAEATELLTKLAALDSGLSDCDRADCLNTVGWVMLRAGVTSSGKALDPRVALEEALSLYRGTCPRPAMEVNALVNLALLALLQDDVAAAKQWLEQARARREQWDDFIASWMLDLEGRVALAEGRAKDALASYEAMTRGAPRLSEAKLRASLGRARCLEARGHRQEAVAEYQRAEELLDEQLRLVPLSEGRGGFVGDREAGGQALVALLLSAGKWTEAFVAARRAIGRISLAAAGFQRISSASSERKGEWEQRIGQYRSSRAILARLEARLRGAASDEIGQLEQEVISAEARARAELDAAYAVLGARGAVTPEPAMKPGEALLVYYPLEGQALAAFLWRPSGLVALKVAMPGRGESSQALSTALLLPFSAQLEESSALRIVAAGQLSGVDFHALPWKGALVADSFAVTYSLDLPARPARGPLCSAAVVADPTTTLSSAPAEATYVIQQLEAAFGPGQVRGVTGVQVDRASFIKLLAEVDVLHFAGHGKSRGVEGFASAVSLAQGESFDVGDALSLAEVPRLVVLSACESAVALENRAAAQGLGLAHAFVLAGSEAVIAATRVTSDRDAFELMKSFYKSQRMSIQPSHALQNAQAEVRKNCAQCDWSAFRVLVP